MADNADIQARIADLALPPDEFLAALPPVVQARVARLERLQSRRERLERNYLRERLVLEAKYDALYEPLYVERSAVVTGASDDAAAAGGGGAGGGGGGGGGGVGVGVPCFWLTALMRCDAIREGMNEKDPDVLRHLTDLTVEKFGPAPKPAKTVEEVMAEADRKEKEGKEGGGGDDSDDDGDGEEEEEPAGFRLRFKFDSGANPYFTNAELVKTYWIEDDGYGEPVLQKSEGTPIDWKAGKNVTVKVMKKKPRRGAAPTAKPQTKTEPVPSFFSFFSPPEIPQTAAQVAELDEDAVEGLREEVEADFEVGMVLRDELVPDALRWFTGEAAEDDDEDEDADEDEDEDEDDDDDEDDDSEESEESGGGGGGGRRRGGGKKGGGGPKRGGGGGGGGGAPGGQPPLGPDGKPQECKQQ